MAATKFGMWLARQDIGPLLNKDTESEPIIWDIGDEEEEYPFVNKYPSFQEEPIVLVEEEACPIYDTKNKEEESMPVYDTNIEDVIKEEEGFVWEKRDWWRRRQVEDIVVVLMFFILNDPNYFKC
ncbi:hypothetical protein Tco_0914582 [Tanacetum coccineum]